MSGAGERERAIPVWHDHLSPDAAGARAFYEAVLGWSFEAAARSGPDYQMIAVGGGRHGGFVRAEDVSAHWLVYLGVDGLEDEIARVERAGGRVHAAPAEIPEIGRFAVVADPAGAVFALWEGAAATAPSQEAFAWDEVYAPDPEAAARFYGDVFGWRTEPFNEVYTLFRSGEATVGGLMTTPEGMPPGWLAYLTTEDVDAAAAVAGEQGARTILAPTEIPNVGRVAVLVDPLGASFGLLSPSS